MKPVKIFVEGDNPDAYSKTFDELLDEVYKMIYEKTKGKVINMTNKEAIKCLEWDLALDCCFPSNKDAIKLALKALKNQDEMSKLITEMNGCLQKIMTISQMKECNND